MPLAHITPDLLAQAGRALHGQDWQRPLARSLGRFHPAGPTDSIDDRLVRRWVAGERPVADWVPAALLTLLEAKLQECDAAIAALEDAVEPV